MKGGRVGREDIIAALALPGVNQKRLAEALGIDAPRVSDWVTGKVQRPNLTHAALGAAVASLTGTLAVTPLDLIELTTGPLAHLEGLAHEMLDVIAETRARLGAGAPAAIPDGGLAGSATAALSARAKQAKARGPKAPRRANHG